MLEARGKDARERCLEVYNDEKRKAKRCIYQSKEEVHEKFGRKMNPDMNENKKLFWKEISKVNGGKVLSCSRIKDRNGKFSL